MTTATALEQARALLEHHPGTWTMPPQADDCTLLIAAALKRAYADGMEAGWGLPRIALLDARDRILDEADKLERSE